VGWRGREAGVGVRGVVGAGGGSHRVEWGR